MEDDKAKLHMPKGEPDSVVSLKNGGRADIRDIQVVMTEFRWLRAKHPGHFQALFDIARGTIDLVTEQTITDLKNWRFLSSPDGSFLTHERDVLLSAGPELQDPFKADTITDHFRAAMAEEEADEDFWRRALSDPKSPRRPSRE